MGPDPLIITMVNWCTGRQRELAQITGDAFLEFIDDGNDDTAEAICRTVERE
jgi:hypothetical protein